LHSFTKHKAVSHLIVDRRTLVLSLIQKEGQVLMLLAGSQIAAEILGELLRPRLQFRATTPVNIGMRIVEENVVPIFRREI
jgi:hypothetical protein